MNRLPLAWLTAIVLTVSGQPAWAHGDEDHSHDEPAVASTTGTQTAAQTAKPDGASTRAASQTETFELVAVLSPAAPPPADTAGDAKASNAPTLTIYLDDFATNAPVANAKVEVESGAFKAVATMQSAGIYSTPAPALAKPGRYPLTVSVETEATADLLDVVLDTSAAGSPGNARAGHGDASHGVGRWAWGLGAAIALALIAVVGIGMARRRAGARS